MATAPAFESTQRVGLASVTVANTNRDGTGTLVDVVTGVTAGTKIDRVVIKASGTAATGLLTLFYFDGTTNWLFDEIVITGVVASTTVPSFRADRTYPDLVIAAATHKLRAAVTVAPTSGAINVEAFGGDLT